MADSITNKEASLVKIQKRKSKEYLIERRIFILSSKKTQNEVGIMQENWYLRDGTTFCIKTKENICEGCRVVWPS